MNNDEERFKFRYELSNRSMDKYIRLRKTCQEELASLTKDQIIIKQIFEESHVKYCVVIEVILREIVEEYLTQKPWLKNYKFGMCCDDNFHIIIKLEFSSVRINVMEIEDFHLDYFEFNSVGLLGEHIKNVLDNFHSKISKRLSK